MIPGSFLPAVNLPQNHPATALDFFRPYRLLYGHLPVCVLGGPGLRTADAQLRGACPSSGSIERVYYEHRIWPKENPGPKPPFEQMITRAQLEAKVEGNIGNWYSHADAAGNDCTAIVSDLGNGEMRAELAPDWKPLLLVTAYGGGAEGPVDSHRRRRNPCYPEHMHSIDYHRYVRIKEDEL